YRTSKLDVVPVACAVPIHTCQQDLTGPKPFSASRPFDRINSSVPPPTVSVDLPSAARIVRVSSPCVDGYHDTLAPKSLGAGTYHIVVSYCSCVQRNLIGAGAKNRSDIFDRLQAAADSQWDKHLIRNPPYQIDYDRALIR